jgi:hypothetical protein
MRRPHPLVIQVSKSTYLFPVSCEIKYAAYIVNSHYIYKTSGFKTSGFQTSGFKTSETSGLQNVSFAKRQVYKMSGLQNIRPSKRLVAKKTSIYILYLSLVEIRRSVAAMFAGKVMAVFYSVF